MCLGKFAYGNVPGLTNMEACHQASDRQRLQLLKQKHPSRQGDQGGKPERQKENDCGKRFPPRGPGWAPAHSAHLASQGLPSLQMVLMLPVPTFEDRQLEKEKSVGMKEGRGTGKSLGSDPVFSLMTQVP